MVLVLMLGFFLADWYDVLERCPVVEFLWR
jgi:hypothetical protein